MPYGTDSIRFIAALAMCRLRNCAWMQNQIDADVESAKQNKKEEDAAAGKDQRDAIMQTCIRK